MPTATSDNLLSPGFIAKLDRLDILSRKVLRGKMQGERRSKKRGQSVEFADYRNYVVGDDLRRIDWNLYARLDKLFLRLFMEEEDLTVTIAVDTTASMDYGEPNKLLYAKQLAAALGYLGLVHHNRVSVFGFSDTLNEQLMNLRGRQPVPRMMGFLEGLPSKGETPGNLEASCKRLALLQRTPGVVILISDFFDKGDLAGALRYLAADRFDAYAIQLLSPQEAEPAKAGLAGDLSLVDLEDGDMAEVSLTSQLVKRYQANLQAYLQHVKDTCVRRGMMHLLAQTDVPVEDMVMKYLRQRGLVG